MAIKRAWRAVAEALRAEGVRYAFGLPGNPLHFYDDLYDFPEITPVLTRLETSGVFMAMAYAQVSGEVGVCHANPGPGMANTIPGLLEAWSGCFPIVCLASAPSRVYEGMGVFQETDSLGLARPVSKWAVRVDIPERTPWTVARAFAQAANGKPGPVYVEIPIDVAAAAVEMPEYRRLQYPIRCSADPDLVRRAAELLAASRRPVIWAGGGVPRSRAERELVALAERLHAPVVTTPQGRGTIPEDHPLSFGQVGLYRTKSTAMAYDDADLVLIVGSRCEEFQSGAWKLFPAGARMIQIDIDAGEIGRNWVPDVGIVADARRALEQLSAALADAPGAEARRARAQALLEARQRYEAEVDAECATDATPVKTKRVVHDLNKVFGRDTILVNENGGHDLVSYYCPYYKVLSTRGCVAPAEQTCMGMGVAGAIGAKLAAPERDVVCVTGDGAFQMYLHELPTAVQYRTPVVWVVLNDGALGWPRYIQQRHGGRYIATEFTARYDFVQVGRAAGCYAERVTEGGEVTAALARARQATRDGLPAVIDVTIDPDDYVPGFHEFHEKVWGMGIVSSG